MRWVVISLSVQTNKQTNYTGRHRCTLRMFISPLIRYLNKSSITLCGQGDLGSLQFAVCSLLYPEVEEEESHPTVTVKQERLDPEPELEMDKDNETLDDPVYDTLQETVSNVSATNQSIKLNTSYSQDPYSLGVKVPGDQNQDFFTESQGTICTISTN